MAATQNPNPGGTQPAGNAQKAGPSREDDDNRTGQAGGVQSGGKSPEGASEDRSQDDDKTQSNGGENDGDRDRDGFEMIRKHHGKLRAALGDADTLRAPNAARQLRRTLAPLWAEHVRMHETLRDEAEDAGFDDSQSLGEIAIEADLISILLSEQDLDQPRLEPGRMRVATRMIRELTEREERSKSGLLDKVRSSGVDAADLGRRLGSGGSRGDTRPGPRHLMAGSGGTDNGRRRQSDDARRSDRQGYGAQGAGQDRGDDRQSGGRPDDRRFEGRPGEQQGRHPDDDRFERRFGGRDYGDDRRFRGQRSDRPGSGPGSEFRSDMAGEGWSRDDEDERRAYRGGSRWDRPDDDRRYGSEDRYRGGFDEDEGRGRPDEGRSRGTGRRDWQDDDDDRFGFRDRDDDRFDRGIGRWDEGEDRFGGRQRY